MRFQHVAKHWTGVNPVHDGNWRRMRHVWILLLMGLLLPVGSQAASETPEICDGSIRKAIQHRLDAAFAPTQNGITVQVDAGIVLLSGTADNLLHQRQARQIAESLRGVRAVVDTTRLTPSMRDDTMIARNVRQRIWQSLNRKSSDIAVAVDNGEVTLSGVVDSWVLSRLISRRSMAVDGVTAVVNQIDVKPSQQREDTAIRSDVMRRLAADLYVDARHIDVTVVNGRVVLEGTVPTLAQKRRTAANAWVAGTTEVVSDELQVDGVATDNLRRPAPYISTSDQLIHDSVVDALCMDPRVNSAVPDVKVVNGSVTLSGAVDTLFAKRAAEADARNTTGVWNVDNQLRLRYRSFPPDQEVKRLITDVLRRDAALHTRKIEVAVEANHVVLSGSVSTLAQKVRAENIVSQIPGVLTLANRIQVTGKKERASDAEIAAAIADEWYWSPYVDSDRITVAVTDGHAVIRGLAANRFVGRIAVQNAFEGGARSVRTRLTLNDGSMLADNYEKKPDPSPDEAAWWLGL